MLLRLNSSFFHSYIDCGEVLGSTYPSSILIVHLRQERARTIITRAIYFDHIGKRFRFMKHVTTSQTFEL